MKKDKTRYVKRNTTLHQQLDTMKKEFIVFLIEERIKNDDK